RLREVGRYIGIGMCAYVEPTGWGSAGAKVQGFPAEFYDSASVTVEPDGSVTVTTGTHKHGQGHHTSLPQGAADAPGVRLENVRIVDGDTGSAVYGFGTYASRTAVVAGGSVMRAAADVREKLVRLTAHALEANPEDIEIYDGKASVKGSPEKAKTVG